MSIKQKYSKQKRSVQDREDNKKFMLVLAVATIVLMGLMYLAFR